MKSRRFNQNTRKGNILVLTAFLLIGLMAMLAFAIDVGFLHTTRQQLQRSADSAALAACWKMLDEEATTGLADASVVEMNAKHEASIFASENVVLGHAPKLTEDDVQVGYLANPSDPNGTLVVGSFEPANAVTVRVRRAADINGSVPLFFARALGLTDVAVGAEATAALLPGINGFRIPSDGSNLGMLPIALDEQSCQDMLAGHGPDDYRWDPVHKRICSGSDGCVEVNLFPQGTGSPGNRGTVDIGSNNNSTKDISRQISDGVSPSDLEHHGGELKFDCHGNIYLNGDTGISAGVKDELTSIMGEPRVVPVFREVNGNGNNATYTIVKFVGIRVMAVQLTGSMSKKKVVVQPARIIMPGTIPGESGSQSSHIYSPVWLVR